ncbi:MAG: glycosyltransferase [Lachnospiraceae bacterium]|nr:glycosyltransferase [Lachnospiraceae bacterium]
MAENEEKTHGDPDLCRGMMSATVSIIVPVYNVEKYIRGCVDSLLSQTLEDIEIILVDDGSRDGCPGICDEYAERDDRVRVIHQQNRGLPGARNAGLSAAGGSFVMFVDGDDRITSDAAQRLTAAMDEDDDILIFNIVRDNGDGIIKEARGTGRITALSDSDRKKVLSDTLDPMREEYPLLHHQRVSACTKLYRKAFLDENDIRFPENVKVHEDIPFALDVYHHAAKIRYTDIDIYHYRYNPLSITAGYRPAYVGEMKDLLACLKAQTEELKDEGITEDRFYDRAAASLIRLLISNLCNRENKKPYAERKKEYKELINSDPYDKMLRSMKIWDTACPLKKRIAVLLLKINSFFIMDRVFSKKQGI